jgi:diguanylate cyclase (GGDEF)-like protein/PAS domain S-box-containing protein
MMNGKPWYFLPRVIFSLRGKLVMSFVGLTLAVALVTLGFAWFGGRQSAEKLASQTATQVTARIAAHVHEYTREAELVAGSALGSVEAGTVAIESASSWERYLWQASKVSELATYAYVGTETGLFVGVDRSVRGVAHTRIRMPEDLNMRTFAAKQVGDRNEPVPIQTVAYDPRERGWYKQVKAAGAPIFTEPYMSASKKIPVVTYAVPLRDAAGQFSGAFGVDFTLTTMAAYLQKLPPSENGVVVLKSAKGMTLATSQVVTPGDPALPNPLIAALEKLGAAPLQSQWIDDGAVLSVQNVRGAINGTVAVAIPAQDIWADARASWWRALAISGGLTVLAIALGVAWLHSVVRDLSALRKAVKQFEAGTDVPSLPVGRRDEIGSLARAFAAMSTRVTSELLSSRTQLSDGQLAQRRAEETHRLALARSQEEGRRLAAIVDVAQDCIAIVGADGKISYANPAFCAELRVASTALMGAAISDFMPDRRAESGRTFVRLHAAAQQGAVVRETVLMRRSDGSDLHLELTVTPVRHGADDTMELAVIGRNVSDAVKRSKQLSREAKYDPITNLYRRDPLLNALRTRMRAEPESPYSLLFIDLDGFKSINDRHGHAAGDIVLAEVGAAIRHCIREGDIAARFGGDEFVIALFGDKDESTASSVSTRLLDEIAEIAQRQYPDVTLAASIGIASFPHDSRSVSALARMGDQAMYAAKRSGGGRSASWRQIKQRPSVTGDVVVSLLGRSRSA